MLKRKGVIQWQSHGHSVKSHGLISGKIVATIFKNKNHTYINKSIYSVEVLNRRLNRNFRYLKDARAAAQTFYETAPENDSPAYRSE